MENKTKTAIERLVTFLSEKSRVADDLEQNSLAIKMYASDLQAYIGSKLIEIEVQKEEKYIQSLTEDNSLCKIQLGMKIDKQLSNITDTINSF